LASWAFLVLGVGLGAVAIAAEIINVREVQGVRRFELVDELIVSKMSAQRRTNTENGEAGQRKLQSQMTDADHALQDFADTDQTILVSTAENTVYVRRGGNVVFKAICSTGKGDTVVETSNGVDRELPAGAMILAGNTIVIPPINVKQRHFAKVLGGFRLNLGDGYALHGTQQTAQLGRSVSHGCVRLGDKDL